MLLTDEQARVLVDESVQSYKSVSDTFQSFLALAFSNIWLTIGIIALLGIVFGGGKFKIADVLEYKA